jgi:hypothetical protein
MIFPENRFPLFRIMLYAACRVSAVCSFSAAIRPGRSNLAT